MRAQELSLHRISLPLIINTQVEPLEPPIESLTVTQHSASEFAATLRGVGINTTSEQILRQLRIQHVAGADGKRYEIAVAYVDPETAVLGEAFEGEYPLLARAENGVWSSSLRQLAAVINLRIGTSIAKSYTIPQVTDAELTDLQRTEFNSGLLSLYWPNMEKERGSVDYSMRIASASFADNNQMDLIGHLLLWGKDVPQWVRSGNFSRDQLIEIMEARVRNTITTMIRYGVKSYIVVSESGSGADIFLEGIGEDYVQMAFQAARDTSHELGLPLKLIYNDYDNSTPTQERTARTMMIVRNLKQKALIDAVGLETIINYPDDPSVDEMVEAIQAYGIPVIISESAVNMKLFQGPPSDREKKQAVVFYNLVTAALKSEMCRDFVVFVPVDELTPWEREPSLWGYSPDSDPSIYHLVNGRIQPKLSYYTVKKAMLDFVK